MLKRFLVVAFVTACGLMLPAYAVDAYVGASYLSTNADFETAVDDFSTDDAGWKIFGGFNFVKFVGIELSYRDLGTFEDTSGSSTVNADLVSYDGALRGILPLGKWFEVFAKAGYSNVAVELEASDGLSSIVSDENNWELFYGAGFGINFGEHFGIRAEWEEYDVDASLNAFSVGGLIKF